MEGHIFHLQLVSAAIKKHRLRFMLSKCFLDHESVALLGHIVDKGGLRADPNKIRVILNAPVLTSRTELCSFLGIVSY